MPKCDFATFLQLLHGCSAVNWLHIFRTFFYRTPLDDYFWPLLCRGLTNILFLIFQLKILQLVYYY